MKLIMNKARRPVKLWSIVLWEAVWPDSAKFQKSLAILGSIWHDLLPTLAKYAIV